MTGPRPNTMHAVVDAYRADALERESLLRTIEKRNRQLEAENALRHRELLFSRDTEEVVFALGLFAGAALVGVKDAIDLGERDALVVWGALAVLFVGARLAMRVFVRGKKP